MATKKKQIAIAGWVAQTQAEAADAIRQIGDKQRELTRLKTAMNDQIAAVTATFEGDWTKLQAEIDGLGNGVQIWATANRSALTANLTIKSANLITGEIAWRFNPASVSITKAEDVLNYMQEKPELARFIRTAAEINKIALLAEPDEAVKIPGVKIKKGTETFTITPFEQDAS